jgi:hypothetical protein
MYICLVPFVMLLLLRVVAMSIIGSDFAMVLQMLTLWLLLVVP